MQIKAGVLGRIPDKFAGKEAVVLPSIEQLAKKIAQKSDNKADVFAKIAAERLIQAAQNSFSLRKEYVLLERENESELDAEVERGAQDGNAARIEGAKLKAEKVADSMLLFDLQPVRIRGREDKLRGKSIYHASASISGELRFVDLATRGIIASAQMRIEECTATSEISPDDAIDLIRRQFGVRVSELAAVAYSKLFWEFSPFKLRIDEQGQILPQDNIVSENLASIQKIEIQKSGQTAATEEPDITLVQCKNGKLTAPLPDFEKTSQLIAYRIVGLSAGADSSMSSGHLGEKVDLPKPDNQSVVFSSLKDLEDALMGNDRAAQPLASRLARNIQQAIRSHFEGRKDYVVLDRSYEGISDGELDRAVTDNVAKFEREKLLKERAADLAVVFDFAPIEARAASQQFKFADSLNTVMLNVSGNLKLIEIATKIEISSIPFSLGPVAARSVGDGGLAAMEVEQSVLDGINKISAMTMTQIFWALNKSLGKVSSKGKLEFESASFGSVAEEITRVQLALLDAKGERVSNGKEYEVIYENGELMIANFGSLAGQPVAVKIVALQRNSTSGAATKESEEKANSILNKFK